MKSLTVKTKKFTQDELVALINIIESEKEDQERASALFEDFITDPQDDKWKTGKSKSLPHEMMEVVVMLKQIMPTEYKSAVQEFIEPHRRRTEKQLEQLSIFIVKLQMRLK